MLCLFQEETLLEYTHHITTRILKRKEIGPFDSVSNAPEQRIPVGNNSAASSYFWTNSSTSSSRSAVHLRALARKAELEAEVNALREQQQIDDEELHLKKQEMMIQRRNSIAKRIAESQCCCRCVRKLQFE